MTQDKLEATNPEFDVETPYDYQTSSKPKPLKLIVIAILGVLVLGLAGVIIALEVSRPECLDAISDNGVTDKNATDAPTPVPTSTTTYVPTKMPTMTPTEAPAVGFNKVPVRITQQRNTHLHFANILVLDKNGQRLELTEQVLETEYGGYSIENCFDDNFNTFCHTETESTTGEPPYIEMQVLVPKDSAIHEIRLLLRNNYNLLLQRAPGIQVDVEGKFFGQIRYVKFAERSTTQPEYQRSFIYRPQAVQIALTKVAVNNGEPGANELLLNFNYIEALDQDGNKLELVDPELSGFDSIGRATNCLKDDNTFCATITNGNSGPVGFQVYAKTPGDRKVKTIRIKNRTDNQQLKNRMIGTTVHMHQQESAQVSVGKDEYTFEFEDYDL